ncbi:MAG: polymer-forming cytoskeletal protein [Candidatus Sulfobium sp.]|jgi:cytoskeletal protein CcmA (bactofilin family)
MFGKNTGKLESIIGADSHFKGEIETKGTLRIDGGVEGNVRADWVVIGEKALIRGDVAARGIIVGGKVEGNLRAKEIVELKNKGNVSGEIYSNKLTIAEGALFEGKSFMQKEEKVVEISSKEKSG